MHMSCTVVNNREMFYKNNVTCTPGNVVYKRYCHTFFLLYFNWMLGKHGRLNLSAKMYPYQATKNLDHGFSRRVTFTYICFGTVYICN